MIVFYVLTPVALLLAAAGVTAFLWSVRSGQFDDVETPAIRMLLDDDPPTGSRTGSRTDARSDLDAA
jgi:cbb3-type cytochrome oxidase maturation protein